VQTRQQDAALLCDLNRLTHDVPRFAAYSPAIYTCLLVGK
jgi:hypothetical protein